MRVARDICALGGPHELAPGFALAADERRCEQQRGDGEDTHRRHSDDYVSRHPRLRNAGLFQIWSTNFNAHRGCETRLRAAGPTKSQASVDPAFVGASWWACKDAPPTSS